MVGDAAGVFVAAGESIARVDLPKKKRKPFPMPVYLAKALVKNKRAATFFASLAPTYQREYIVWLRSAKLPETRTRRLKEDLLALTAGRKRAQRKR